MALSHTTCLTLQRVVLPIVLVLAALFRPVGISFVYLLMFFISPFIPVATKTNFKGSVTAYLIILIALSTLVILCHIGLQVSILTLQLDNIFGTCSFTERLLRHVGFIGFHNLQPFSIIEWLAPEVVVFITSLVVYLVVKKITQAPEPQLENGEADAIRDSRRTNNKKNARLTRGPAEITAADDGNRQNSNPSQENAQQQLLQRQQLNEEPNFDALIKISPLFCLATLFFSAVLRPSVPGGFYFLIFLLSGSYWATFQTLQRKFAMLLRFVMVVIVAHTLAIVAYQLPWTQEHLDKESLTARLIGLEPLVTSSCATDIRIIIYDFSFKLMYFNPLVLFFTYYALALTTKNLIKLRVTLRRDPQRPPNTITAPTETTPLMRSSIRKSTDMTVQPSMIDIPLGPVEGSVPVRQEDDFHSAFWDQIAYGITGVGGFIYQNSYIFTNVLMMAWSIVYHSWLTFVLLLCANVLWMIPNQRMAMMRFSPFIVVYAELLVIAQYIYGMNLTNDELPSKVDITGINLEQIGFDRPQEHNVQPCIPLIVKTSFLLMFWVTLRQFFREKTIRRRDSNTSDMFNPPQLIATDYAQGNVKKTSRFLKKAGTVIKNLLVRLWIWLLVLVIFLCAMTGKQMTGFRICYMALFLFFLLVFQSSSKVWVKLMYGFWLFLIFYAMFILILIYTYQFDKFDQYWDEYLNVSISLQRDIGLEIYKTKDLFLHLLSPTLIVVLTVIQVHYFHKRFIASLNQPPTLRKAGKDDAHMRRRTKSTSRMSEADAIDFTESAGNLVRLFFKRLRRKAEQFFKHFKDVFWSLLELHWIKLVYISAFVCAVSESTLLHVPFIALCLFGAIVNVRLKTFLSRIISLWVAIIVLSKMVYQITYLDHSVFNVTCPDNSTHNVAAWFGLTKATAESGLMGLIKKYIVYMVMATLHAVITLRQYQMRRTSGTQNDPLPKVPFPNITREDAETDLAGMIKYLLNYGFYKFGYEISLIALVATITYRQDIVAVVYAVWFVLLLSLQRSRVSNIWSVLLIFLLASILLQYVVLVNFPPNLCLVYPWTNSIYSNSIQRWGMLPGPLEYDHSKKLIFDFILLLFVSRQKRVFQMENIANYPGGSNKSVVNDIANLGKEEDFINPTHDFLSHVRNYLDICKHAVLCGFYWITLAVIFLAGTNIADFLALGYLIGAFIFLWEGSDFYLRPIDSILRRWKLLISYNIANIVIKTFLQMAGCMSMNVLSANCCWLVHMLGINCASNTNVDEPIDSGDFSKDCPAIKVQVVLLWDAICFAFLIIQLRIFKSHYFCHIINDTRANNVLASRGAEIIESLRQKQIDKREVYEEEVLQKIKRKMEKIRTNQQKLLRTSDKPSHFDEHGNPVYVSRPHKRKEIKLHPQAVRAGDYYMFEDVDEKFELDLITSHRMFDHDNENITESEIKMNRRKTLYHVWKDISEEEENRRQSYSRQRSYASAPPSHIGLLFEESMQTDPNAVGNRVSTVSEPIQHYGVQRSTSEYFEVKKPKEHEDDDQTQTQTDSAGPSTSKGESAPRKVTSADSKQKMEVDSADLTEKDSDEDFETNPIIRLLEGFLVSLTIRLNRFSRNYRYVNKILEEEKIALKESNNLGMFGGQFATKNAVALFDLMRRNASDENIVAADSNNPQTTTTTSASNRNSYNNAQQLPTTFNQSQEQQQQQQSQIFSPQTQPPLSPQQQLQQEQQQQQHNIHAISSSPSALPEHNNDGDEAILIEPLSLDVVDAGIKHPFGNYNETALQRRRGRKSEPLPEIRIKAPSFDRGHRGSGPTLSKQWPQEKVNSRDFVFDEDDFASRDHNIIVEVLISAWYAILSNTDCICYIVVFINQVVSASLISLPLPLMVFIWGTLSLPRPTKTFWVTLIAYTQAIVLIKCIFQFKLIWTNYHYNLPNNPLGLEKLFGVEQSPHYATYDLLLLLVLFFHRFILKSHGLWKTDTVIAVAGDQTKSRGSIASSYEEDKQHTRGNDRRRSDDSEVSTSSSHLSLRDDKKLQRTGYISGLTKFFHNLVHTQRLPTDVYALMFLCDFVNFFVLLFGFTAFSSRQSGGGVKTFLAENKVPVPFLIMLLVQFLLIVIDRALYLRKALIHKIIFHFISVVGIHIWMFFIVPYVTEQSFYAAAPPIIFYIIKCFYLLLSSYQINCGFPNRISGNFLTKSFSMINMIAFKVYMAIPFLYELRTILDWLCTDTTMTLFDWLKMEDIFAHIYGIKCVRQTETDFPAMRAIKKTNISKLFMGGTAIVLIVAAIWAPLTLFALFNAVGISNVPTEVGISLKIGSYAPLYARTTRESTFVFDDEMFQNMSNAYLQTKERHAFSFLLNYNPSDIAAIKLNGDSQSQWNISPPDKLKLINELRQNTTLTVRFSYELERTPPSKDNTGVSESEVVFEMNDTFPYREQFIDMLRSKDNVSSVVIPNIVPKFIKVLNSGGPSYINTLMLHGESDFRDLEISMRTYDNITFWWEIHDYCSNDTMTQLLKKLPLYDCTSGLVFYTFNDKKFPSTWTFLTAGGIIGLYTTFVLLASRFLKSFLGGQTRRIMYEDLPYVDRVLQLCLDIYLVREALEFMLEEDLFAKLIFLYRSPETMVKWTRPKEEIADDEADTDSVRSRASVRHIEPRAESQANL